MKTWQKITISILIILIAGLVFLYFYGQQTTDPDGLDGPQNPIFPFESPDAGDGDDFFDGDDSDPSEDTPDPTIDQPDRLWLVSDRPVAGSQWVTRDDGTRAIWYIHKENGHLYEHDLDNRQSTRLTNTTIPRVQEAFISSEGDHVIYRYVDIDSRNLKTYLASVIQTPNGDTPYTVDGSFLPDNLTNVSLSPNGDQVFSIQNTTDGIIGVLYSINTEQGEVIFQSPLREWRSEWSTEDEITLFTKPAENTVGVAYQLTTSTREQEKITDGYGLTVSVSPDNQYVLSSQIRESGEYGSRIHESTDPQTAIITSDTLSDKCNWGEGMLYCGIPNNLPNQPLKNWYQGRISFSDQLVSFRLSDREQRNIFRREELDKGPFDITNILQNSSVNHLLFTNKRNDQLWALDLNN